MELGLMDCREAPALEKEKNESIFRPKFVSPGRGSGITFSR